MLNMTWYWHFRMTWMCDMTVLDVVGSLVSIPTTKTQSNGMGTQKWTLQVVYIDTSLKS